MSCIWHILTFFYIPTTPTNFIWCVLSDCIITATINTRFPITIFTYSISILYFSFISFLPHPPLHSGFVEHNLHSLSIESLTEG